MSLRSRLLAVLAVFALVAAACGSSDDAAETTEATTATTVAATTATTEATEEEMAEPGTIIDVAVEAGSFTTLAAALDAAGLIETLQGDGPFTVFAPTDEAFAALPEGTVESLLEDIPALTDILLYHVLSGSVMAEDVVGLDAATTVQGSDVAISVDGGNVFLNGSAMVVTTDIQASNGVIHVIDTVILPPAPEASAELGNIVDVAVEAGTFTTLAAALDAAGLVETLQGEGPFTVFAPTDEAFAALPEGTVEGLLADIPALTDILLYHVLSGSVFAEDVVTLEAATTVQGADIVITIEDGIVYLNGNAAVQITDIAASNGVIHVIDAVILPPVN